jgi:hypothetical protein
VNEFTDDQLMEMIRRSLAAHDWRGVEAGLRVLAVQSPRDAEAILEVIKLVSR